MCSPVLVGCCACASFKSYDRSSNIGLQLGSYRSVTRIMKTLCIQNDEILVNECMNYKPFLFTNPYLFADAAPLKWLLEPEQKTCFHWNTWRVHLQVACNSRPLSMCDLALMVEIPLSMRFQNPSDVQQGSTQNSQSFGASSENMVKISWLIWDIFKNTHQLSFFKPYRTKHELNHPFHPNLSKWDGATTSHIQKVKGISRILVANLKWIIYIYTCISYIYTYL